ncbi:MAG: hypothetical protein ACJATA_000451 [Sphingobacteriales bacterium]|jgi:hypothetical protein
MHKISRDLLIMVPLLISLFSFVACENPDLDEVNLGGQNDKLDGIFTDSLSVGVMLEREDSVNAGLLTRNILGHFKDPIFGETQASLVAQLRLSGNNLNFGEDLTLDSVVLVMKYLDFYGDTTSRIYLKVEELIQDLEFDSVYTSDDTFAVKSPLIGGKLVNPRAKDSVTIALRRNGNPDTLLKVAPQVRIKLDSMFGVKLLNESGSDNFIDNVSFLNFFKGIKISADQSQTQGEGAFIGLDIVNSISSVQLYYKQDTLKKSQSFLINALSASANRYDHNYQNTPVETALANNTVQNERVYIQPMAGINGVIQFPFLEDLKKDGPIAINKAELVFKVEPGTNDKYASPGKFILFREDSLGRILALPDAILGAFYQGGVYNSTDETYTFNIAIYLQDIIDGLADGEKLKMVPDARVIFPQRVVFLGYKEDKKSPNRIKLNLVYTPVD